MTETTSNQETYENQCKHRTPAPLLTTLALRAINILTDDKRTSFDKMINYREAFIGHSHFLSRSFYHDQRELSSGAALLSIEE